MVMGKNFLHYLSKVQLIKNIILKFLLQKNNGIIKYFRECFKSLELARIRSAPSTPNDNF